MRISIHGPWYDLTWSKRIWLGVCGTPATPRTVPFDALSVWVSAGESVRECGCKWGSKRVIEWGDCTVPRE